MAPKKPAAPVATKTKADVPQCGLLLDNCPFPYWDEADLEREAFGDIGNQHVDTSQLYIDSEIANPPVVDALSGTPGIEWKRPAVIFSPFKPVVYRSTMPGNPYDAQPPVAAVPVVAASDGKPPAAAAGAPPGPAVLADDDDESSTGHRPASRQEAIDMYRVMKAFKTPAYEEEEAAAGAAGKAAAVSTRRAAPNASRRRERQVTPTPFFMRAFNSALMVLFHNQHLVAQSNYAWELIHPQIPGTNFPVYNPNGKYAVKLFVAGAYRRVMIDDRLPTDMFGQSVFTVTEQKEIWPALLAKAILKAVGPQNENLVFVNPVFVLSTLLGGWVPSVLNPHADEALVYRTLRQAMQHKSDPAGREPLILTCMCNDVIRDAKVSRVLQIPGGAAGAGTNNSTIISPAGPNAPSTSTSVAASPEHSPTHHATSPHGTISTGDPAVAALEAQWHAAGLQPNQLFSILDIRPLNNTALVRLCSPGVSWKGMYSYDSNAWTAEFESVMGFSVATDRNRADVQRRWFDMWVPWESFVRYFKSFAVLRNVFDKRLGSFKTVLCPGSELALSGESPQAPAKGTGAAAKGGAPAAGGKAIAPAASSPSLTTGVTDASLIAHQDKNAPKNVTKWFHVNNDQPANALLVLHGLGRVSLGAPPPTPSGHAHPPTASTPHATSPAHAHDSISALPLAAISYETHVTVELFTWNASVPFRTLTSLSAPPFVQQSHSFLIPGGGAKAMRVTIEKLAPGCALSLLSSVEATLGDEKDVVKDALGITVASDAGCHGEHVNGQPNIWFKRLLTVRQPTNACFTLSTLPKGTDLAAHRTLVIEAAAAGKGGAAPKGAAGGKKKDAAPVATADFPPDQYDDKPHDTPLIDYATLALIDLDTSEVLNDTISKILNVKLAANKNGYALVAYAKPPAEHPSSGGADAGGEFPKAPETYGKGYWRLGCSTDRPLESYEPRAFEELVARNGSYSHNDVSSLFRFHVTAADPCTGSIVVRVNEASGIPFVVTLLHNDKELDRRTGVHSTVFEHVTFTPPEKTVPSVYSVQCTLDRRFTEQWELARRQLVVVKCRKELDIQRIRMQERHDTVLRLLQENPAAVIPPLSQSTGGTTDGAGGASSPQQPASPPSSHHQAGGAADMRAATIGYTLNFHFSSSKLDIKEDHSISDGINAIKMSWVALDKKDAAPGAAGGAPAKGASKPAPAAAKGAPVVDDAAVHFQKAKEARERFLNNRAGVFVPFVAPGGKVVLTPTDDPAWRAIPPQAPQARDSSHRLHAGLAPSGAPIHDGIHRPYVPPPPPAVEKPVVAKLIEGAQAHVAAMKESRKMVYHGITEATTELWQELRPNTAAALGPSAAEAAAAAEPVDDKAAKGKGGGAKPGKK